MRSVDVDENGPVTNSAEELRRSDRGAALWLEDLTFGYGRTGQPIFEDLSFAVGDGEFVSVVGPSGCGKSTLLRLVAGLLLPQSGTVTVEGEEMRTPSPTVSIVFQSDTLLPWRTALKNVVFGIEHRMPKREAQQRAQRLLELVGLGDAAKRYPHQLSGGMRQRVNLARALATDPNLLLMDEPFAALDAQTREAQQEHLLSVWRQEHKTVLFVTHDIDEAVFLADRVIVLGLPPAGVIYEISVDMERPRDMSLKKELAFRQTVDEIRHVIGSHAQERQK